MKSSLYQMGLVMVGVGMLWAGTALALSDAEKCEAAKLKEAGKYGFCRMKAEATAIKKGLPPDYTKCDSKLTDKWGKAETKAGPGVCPSEGDEAAIQTQVTADTDDLALKLSGQRFIDNGDGTVTDTQTGLMWEQKTGVVGTPVDCIALDDCTDPHDVNNEYPWTINTTEPTGYLFTNFLGRLNGAHDGICFAGHCDWRIPTVDELETILLAPYPCGTNPCIDAIFGPTQSSLYWSATTHAGVPLLAWFVDFNDGSVVSSTKTFNLSVRAVRGGL